MPERWDVICVLLVVLLGAGWGYKEWGGPGLLGGALVGLLSGVLTVANRRAYGRLKAGLGPLRPYTGPHADLIGRSGVVVDHVEAGVLVQLGDREWPARLPPFTPRPPIGAAVHIETVADDILIVRPDA